MKPLPVCIKCQKSPYVHGLLSARLWCSWDGRKGGVEADFGGPQIQALVVEAIYLGQGQKVPAGARTKAIEARKAGYTID